MQSSSGASFTSLDETVLSDSEIPKKKQVRKEYSISNRSCEIVVNGLNDMTSKYKSCCKSKVRVLKVNPRTKFKTHFCVTGVTDIMERVQTLDFSNRLVFLDGTANANRFNCAVFTFSIDSHVGALPFAFFITSYKSSNLLDAAFTQLGDILPNNVFSSATYPKVVITGIDSAEFNATSKCFSLTKTYIGTFQLLRDMWRFVWDPENNISPSHRTHIYRLFKEVVNSLTEEHLNGNIWNFCESEYTRQYSGLLTYFNGLLKKKEFWALDYRIKGKLFYNKNTMTSEMHVLKENILHSSRTKSVPELFEYFCTDYTDYYKNKIQDAITGCIESISELRYMQDVKDDLSDLKVGTTKGYETTVISLKRVSEFYVNCELGTCTCVLGKYGSPCAHQYAIAINRRHDLFRIASMSPEDKAKYRYLSTGESYLEYSLSVDQALGVDPLTVDQYDNEYGGTEYVLVPEVEVQTRTSEDCISAIEIFWSKLCPYTKDTPNKIYNWISGMNEKLDNTSNLDEVLDVLYHRNGAS